MYDAVGGYILDAAVGRGASGTVWRAHPAGHPRRTVAVKRLRSPSGRDGAGHDRLDRLRYEADVLAELDHLHIVRILDVVADAAGPALVMQYAGGGSLADLLRQRGALAAGEVVAVLAPIADALDSAHRRSLVHGDVKPANILFTSDGQPLLADFGIARSSLAADSEPLEGTAEYLAPEQRAATAPDPRSDIYALGMVARQAVAGQAVPAALATAIARATQPDPADRFARAEDLARALRHAVDHRAVRLPGPAGATGRWEDAAADTGTRQFGPRPPRRERSESRPIRRRAVSVTLGMVAAAAAGAAVLWHTAARSDPSPCPEPATVSVPSGGATIQGDTDGSGCPETGFWVVDPARTPSLVVVIPTREGGPPMSYGVGRNGDQPVLGDWNCDGRATLALYRPSQGEVYTYEEWPESGALQTTAQTGRPIGATPRVERFGACDRLIFDAPA